MSTDYQRAGIYLDPAKPEPKHLFVTACDSIAAADASPASLLDVGGASGDFAAYAAQRFTDCSVEVVEYDQQLVTSGRQQLPDINFHVGDANNMPMFTDKSFAATTMLGVHSVFDDFRPSFDECIRVTADGGVIVIADIFNEHPVDALIYWRHADNSTGEFTRGHNLFSKASASQHLDTCARIANYAFTPFELPFDLPRRDDPMRSWTELMPDGRRRFMDGLMPLNIEVLTIRLL